MLGKSMRLLTLSLITGVLVATIGLGWALDNLFYYFSPDTDNNIHNITTLETIGQDLSTTLNDLEQPKAFINNWPKQGHFNLVYFESSDIQLPQALMTQVREGQPLLLTDDNEISLYYFLSKHNSWLVVKSTLIDDGSNNASIKLILTLVFYAFLIFFIWMWTHPLIARLINLRNTAQAFGKGQLEQRIEVGAVSYVKDLELEFNQMAQRITNLVNDVKLIGSAVSHDMRTPLARMRFGIDTIAEEEDPAQQKRYLQRLGQDVDEMTKLVEVLLDYSRLEQVMINLDKTSVNISKLVEGCIHNKQSDKTQILFDSQKQLDFPDEDVMVTGDSKYLSILINNLLQNAINYGKSTVHVKLYQDKDNICLTIADDGAGFNDNHQDMLKPFVRGNAATDITKGYGMGLAIVNRITEWHNGQLKITRCETLLGARVEVRLPR
ncbi:HAMP domain-containing sensor histidine kinase [Psychrosphaera saromensis]|nr:ATP-binding protein [Psychrosphaera saromensis]